MVFKNVGLAFWNFTGTYLLLSVVIAQESSLSLRINEIIFE